MNDNKNTNTNKMTEEELNTLADKIVNRMVRLKTMESWYDQVNASKQAWITSYDNLELTEEQDAVSEAAKLMTLMNLFQETEEYEKCAVIKSRLEEIQKILNKY